MRLRKFFNRPAYEHNVFTSMSASVCDAEFVVKLYYAVSIYLSCKLLINVDELAQPGVAWDFLWPLAWLSDNAERSLRIMAVLCFLASLAAFQFYRHAVARACFAGIFLLVATVPNSLGGINHPYHAWFLVGFLFIFLPDGRPADMNRAGKLSYLTVIRAAQSLFLLFYTMTGTWKLFFGTASLAAGQFGNFSPEALPQTLANRILQTGTDPLLADFIINNAWLAWPMFLCVIYIQVVSLAVAFRPRLHVLWGYFQIAFHLGTWLLMQIMFSEHVLLLAILLVLSPQRTPFRLAALGDLPLLGWLFRLYLPAAHPSPIAARQW
ncbi:hypothetical protein [Mesorhizobium captivum]|uniref:hypothetical protein n=1 Tax=Mesorhizobium captivum TaxID=3072319 RepID=UPI002A24C647|nr:hypothetical protein [Mesorhizobium sp. VK23E]MDX8513514.1 hypothetical protein [Mesorhizobium sp. VK23E]